MFKDLHVGDTFDFISPQITFNSFYARCEKVSTRCYLVLDGKLKGEKLRVGSVTAKVYHVESR